MLFRKLLAVGLSVIYVASPQAAEGGPADCLSTLIDRSSLIVVATNISMSHGAPSVKYNDQGLESREPFSMWCPMVLSYDFTVNAVLWGKHDIDKGALAEAHVNVPVLVFVNGISVNLGAFASVTNGKNKILFLTNNAAGLTLVDPWIFAIDDSPPTRTFIKDSLPGHTSGGLDDK